LLVVLFLVGIIVLSLLWSFYTVGYMTGTTSGLLKPTLSVILTNSILGKRTGVVPQIS